MALLGFDSGFTDQLGKQLRRPAGSFSRTTAGSRYAAKEVDLEELLLGFRLAQGLREIGAQTWKGSRAACPWARTVRTSSEGRCRSRSRRWSARRAARGRGCSPKMAIGAHRPAARLGERHRIDDEIHLSSEQRGHGVGRALERHVQDVDAGALLEHLAVELGDAAQAGGAEAQLAGLLFRQRDEVAHALHRRVLGHHRDAGRGGHQSHRLEAERVPACAAQVLSGGASPP